MISQNMNGGKKRSRQDTNSNIHLPKYLKLSVESETICTIDNRNIFVGTSGYSYPSWHKHGCFYPKGTRGRELEFYMQEFNSVELNYSHYRMPTENNLANWRDKIALVRPNFLFVFKVHRWFTHMKLLVVDEVFVEKWLKFWTLSKSLGANTGPLLFQLPPSLKFNLDKSIDKLKKLHSILSPDGKYVFEFRDKSWYCPQVYQLFKEFDWCLCRLNLNNTTGWAGYLLSGNWPPLEVPTEDYSCSWGVYFRYHGTSGQYVGSYGPEFLTGLKKTIEEHIQERKEVYIFFNNTDERTPPSAIQDARFLSGTLKL